MGSTPSPSSPAAGRGDRRKARTRAALIRAAQRFVAEGRQNAPILEITEAADVGMGSFYNHFASREALFEAALLEALEAQGALLDRLGTDEPDPAARFARSFRLTGRMHRLAPQISRVLLSRGLSLMSADTGLAPRVRRDLGEAREAGLFHFADLDLAVALATGAALTLGQLLHDQPDRDDATAADGVTGDLLRAYGLGTAGIAVLLGAPLPDLAAPLSPRWSADRPA